MNANWSEAFFASEVEFDHLPESEALAAAGSDRVSSPRGFLAAFTGAVSANVAGLLTAVVIAVAAHPDISETRIVEAGLGSEAAAVDTDAWSPEPAAVPDDVLAPGPQDLHGLARVLKLGRRAEGLDHLL